MIEIKEHMPKDVMPTLRNRINLIRRISELDNPKTYNELLKHLTLRDKFAGDDAYFFTSQMRFRRRNKYDAYSLSNPEEFRWFRFRGYDRYNSYISKVLDYYSIANFIRTNYIDKKKQPNILDYGCGSGVFLSDLSRILSRTNGRDTFNLSGFTMNVDVDLDKLKRAGVIDDVYYGQSYKFSPKKEYDIIFDVHGPIYHSSISEREFELRKVCSLLALGGSLLFLLYPRYVVPDSLIKRNERLNDLLEEHNEFSLGEKRFKVMASRLHDDRNVLKRVYWIKRIR